MKDNSDWLFLQAYFLLCLVANRRHNENTFRFTPVNATSVLSFRNLGSSFCFALPVWCENSTETKQDTRDCFLPDSYITLLILYLTQSCTDIESIMIARGKVTITKKDNKTARRQNVSPCLHVPIKHKIHEKEHNGKRGCGAKRFSGAHPLRRAFHVRSGWLFFLSDFKRRFALVCVAIARAVFESSCRACACLPARSAGTCIKTSTRPAHMTKSRANLTQSQANLTIHEYFVSFGACTCVLLPV